MCIYLVIVFKYFRYSLRSDSKEFKIPNIVHIVSRFKYNRKPKDNRSRKIKKISW